MAIIHVDRDTVESGDSRQSRLLGSGDMLEYSTNFTRSARSVKGRGVGELQFRRKEAGRLAVGAAWGRCRHQRAGRPAAGRSETRTQIVCLHDLDPSVSWFACHSAFRQTACGYFVVSFADCLALRGLPSGRAACSKPRYVRQLPIALSSAEVDLRSLLPEVWIAAHPEHFLTYRRDEDDAAAIARRRRRRRARCRANAPGTQPKPVRSPR